MKKNTFKDIVITSIVTFSLAFLSGCGGGGGGSSASGGYAYLVQNPENANGNSSSENNENNGNNGNNGNSENNNNGNSENNGNNGNNGNSGNSETNESTLRKNYNYSISGKGDIISLIMDCGATWQIDVSALPSNVTVNPSSGNGNGEKLTITVSKNTSNEEQKINIPVTIKNGTKITTISINQAIDKTKEWLFINYFACDNNLADFQLDSLNDMEKVGSDENTNIIVYYDLGDRSNLVNGKYENIISKNEWDGGPREFYLVADSTNNITSPVIKYYDDQKIDSAHPEILADFLLRAIEKYPAEKICITITNHGGAYLGAISDDTNEEGETISTSLSGLRYAFDKVYKKIGKKIDLLLFDDCVMANFEVAYEFKDIVSYIVGSEEVSLVSILDGMNGSFDYNGFLSNTKGISNSSRLNTSRNNLEYLNSSTVNLSNQIRKVQRTLKSKIAAEYDGKTLAEAVYNANKARRDQFFAGNYPFTNYNTCSIIDCGKCDSLKESVSAFANYVKTASLDDKNAVKKATGDLIVTYAKLSDIEDTYANLAKYYGLVDSEDEKYIAYKPLGEVYAPYHKVRTVDKTSYLFSISKYSIADLGLIMQRIYSPNMVYKTIPDEISKASESLIEKAEKVYNSLREVVPDGYYYGTNKISLVESPDNSIYFSPFGYHEYSNGLSIGWFVYDKTDSLNNWSELSSMVYVNKSQYTAVSPNNKAYMKFYEDCPEWIEMQESL